MRKIFGFMFVVLGIVCLPSIIAPTAAETLGRFIGWALTSALPAYLLLRKSSKKSDEEESKNLEEKK